MATSEGLYNVAEEACPPSPLYQAVPVPAIVDRKPVATVTLRTLWLANSLIMMFPEASNTNP